MDAADVAKVERRAVGRLRKDDCPDVRECPKLTCLFEGQLTAFRVHRAGWQGRIACLEGSADGRRYDPERRQAVLRVACFDLLFDDADPRDARGFRRDFDRLFDAIGKIIQFTIRIFRPSFTHERVCNRNARGDDDRIPDIRMNVRPLRQSFPHSTNTAR